MTTTKKKIIVSIISSIAIVVSGITPVSASEVTGTLSSGTSNPSGGSSIGGTIGGGVGGSTVSGTISGGGGGSTISGTVSGGGGGSTISGTVSGGGGSTITGGVSGGGGTVAFGGGVVGPSNGSVLGAFTDQGGAPNFPNAGFDAREPSSLWITVATTSTLLALFALFIARRKIYTL